jgi:hypothetical protein
LADNSLIRGTPLKRSPDLFKGLVLALEDMGFRFTCKVADELVDNGLIIGQVLEQVFFATYTQLA